LFEFGGQLTIKPNLFMKKVLLLLFGALALTGNAQTTSAPTSVPADKEYEVNVYGFIRSDYIWDTRRSFQVREYNLNLYPLDEQLDANGADINAVANSNFLAIVSRLGVKAKGPAVWGAKTSGTLEGDFFGNTEQSIGLLRLRHAYINMDWAKTSLTMGQTWYPSFIPEIFPGVANFNTGILFNPFGWASQVKIKYALSKEFSASLTAYKEREFTTAGGSNATPATTDWAQNSGATNSTIPALHAQFQFRNKNWLAGFGAEYKSLQPLTKSANVATTETVNSTTFIGFLKYNADKWHIKAYGISGENLYNMVMLGGYAGYTKTGELEKYKAAKTTAYWVDLASNGKKIAPGLFLGYTKNGGTSAKGLASGETVKYYMRGVSGTRVVDNVMRASARVDFKQNKLRITPELEYTAANWGDLNTNGSGSADLNTKKVANIRALVSCVYTF
jgi:hypothetical protein